MIRRVLLGLLFLFMCASLSLAKPGVVKTKDGRTLEGDITDNGAEGVTIAMKAASVTLRAQDVASVEYAADIKQAYQQRLAKLPKDAGAQSHFELGRWLFDSKEYDLALKELDAALALDANHAPSALLKQTVERTVSMERNKVNVSSSSTPAPPTSPSTAIDKKDRRYLDADQISTVRQSELKETDRPVRVRLDGDVKKRFLEYDNQDQREFAALSDYDKALRILKKGTPEMRKDVKVLGDPPAIAEFKAKVQPVLLTGCATAACHGGKNGGSFVLYTPAASDAVTYTNFYILSQYGRKVDKTDRKAIDRLYPANSLILQYGMPSDRAEFDHPEVRGWAPVFKNEQDTRYQQVMDWISKSLISIDPKYPPNFFPVPGMPATPAEENKKEEGEPEPAPDAATAENPPPQRRPAEEKQPQGNTDKGNSKTTGNSNVDEARKRIRPINPGSIPIPPLPF
jgi:hypothetical protein